MTSGITYYRGGVIFDGKALNTGFSALTEHGLLTAVGEDIARPDVAEIVELDGDILAPGFVDLQVNGGGGLMFNDDPSLTTLIRMAEAHRGLGATSILPTLITDTPEKTRAAIEAVKAAITAGVRGIAGLHLEGPHLSIARKGAHDAGMIRPMTSDDLAMLIDAARTLPVLMVTVAPETTTPDQVSALADAGTVVSLGHSDAGFETCMDYAAAGARTVTHLFNAMSQLANREPGLVGAALTSGRLSAGLIADGIHVHPASMRAAWAAKVAPGQIFLVSDAMAPAGSNLKEFNIGNRKVERFDGRLTLADGTLAGADLEIGTAVRVLVEDVGIDLEDALRAATSTPADIAGLGSCAGYLRPGTTTDIIRLGKDFRVTTL